MLTPDQISATGNRITQLSQTSDRALAKRLAEILRFLAEPNLSEQTKNHAIEKAREEISKTVSLLRKRTNREVERVFAQSVKQSMVDDLSKFEKAQND